MADLVLIVFDDGEEMRCADLSGAKNIAIARGSCASKVRVEVTPENGGVVAMFEFDHASSEWIAVS